MNLTRLQGASASVLVKNLSCYVVLTFQLVLGHDCAVSMHTRMQVLTAEHHKSMVLGQAVQIHKKAWRCFWQT